MGAQNKVIAGDYIGKMTGVSLGQLYIATSFGISAPYVFPVFVTRYVNAFTIFSTGILAITHNVPCSKATGYSTSPSFKRLMEGIFE